MQQSGQAGQGPGRQGRSRKGSGAVGGHAKSDAATGHQQGKGGLVRARARVVNPNPLQRGNQSGKPQPRPGDSNPAKATRPAQQGQKASKGQGQQGQGQEGQQGRTEPNQAGPDFTRTIGYAPYGGGGNREPGQANMAPRTMEQAYRESLRDLNQFRDFVRANPESRASIRNCRAPEPALRHQ